VLESFYNQVVNVGFLGTGAEILLSFLLLLIGLAYKSEAFEKVVGSRVRGPLCLAYGTFGLPFMLVLMDFQRRRGGGIFRFLGGLVLVVILVIIGVLVLMAFLIYWFLRRRP
jgi:hypothetical protein